MTRFFRVVDLGVSIFIFASIVQVEEDQFENAAYLPSVCFDSYVQIMHVDTFSHVLNL